MAIKLVSHNAREYTGLSSDELPSNPNEGSTFHVVDTGEEYVFYNGTWEPDMRRIYAMQMAEI